MSAGTASALTVVRVARGQPRPSEQDFQAAIERDRVRLHLTPRNALRDLAVAGPYPVTVEGQQFDEYVIWEQ
jgi:hypothetical protein